MRERESPCPRRTRNEARSTQGRVLALLLLVLALVGSRPDVAAAARPAELLGRIVVTGAGGPLGTESDALADARAALPSFTAHESARFVLLTDADAATARTHLERLERTHHQFQRMCRRLDLRPQPLRHRLVAILFRERDAYQQFARTYDLVQDPWIAGYYAPSTDRVVFYDVESNPTVTAARRKLDEIAAEIDALDRRTQESARRGRRGEVEVLRAALARYERHYAEQRDRIETFTAQVATATTIHEALHQLMFHTHVQSPYVQYPIWISEGLATSFETDAANEAFGPDHDFAVRREPFVELLRRDDLMPLRELVALDAVPTDRENGVHVVYHESYALVQWLARHRPHEMRRYLDLMCAEPAGRPTAQRQVEVFESAFGDVERLERAWLRDERVVAARVAAAGAR